MELPKEQIFFQSDHQKYQIRFRIFLIEICLLQNTSFLLLKVYIKEAIEYIKARPDLMALLLVVFCFGTFAALPELFSATMATKVFDKNALDFGILGSCIAVGSMSGSILATKFEWKPSTKSVIILTCWWGLAIIISSLAPTYFWYALILPVYGAVMLITGISALRTAQLGIDAAIRGRIMGIYISVSMGGVVLGAPLTIDADAFKTADGDLEASLRMICEAIHAQDIPAF